MKSFMEKVAYTLEHNKAIYLSVGLALIAIYIFSVCPVAMQNDVFWSIEVGEKLFFSHLCCDAHFVIYCRGIKYT